MDTRKRVTIWVRPGPLQGPLSQGKSADKPRRHGVHREEISVYSVSPWLSYPLYRILQMRFPPSSETSTEPSAVTVTPTGLPHLLFFEGSTTKPVRKSSICPGLPFWNGTKMTFAPFVVERFHE